MSVHHTYLFVDRITCGPSENWLAKLTSNCFIRRWERLFFWSLHLTAEYSSVQRRELVALVSTALQQAVPRWASLKSIWTTEVKYQHIAH